MREELRGKGLRSAVLQGDDEDDDTCDQEGDEAHEEEEHEDPTKEKGEDEKKEANERERDVRHGSGLCEAAPREGTTIVRECPVVETDTTELDHLTSVAPVLVVGAIVCFLFSFFFFFFFFLVLAVLLWKEGRCWVESRRVQSSSSWSWTRNCARAGAWVTHRAIAVRRRALTIPT